MGPGEASRNTTQLSPTQVQNHEQTPGFTQVKLTKALMANGIVLRATYAE